MLDPDDGLPGVGRGLPDGDDVPLPRGQRRWLRWRRQRLAGRRAAARRQRGQRDQPDPSDAAYAASSNSPSRRAPATPARAAHLDSGFDPSRGAGFNASRPRAPRPRPRRRSTRSAPTRKERSWSARRLHAVRCTGVMIGMGATAPISTEVPRDVGADRAELGAGPAGPRPRRRSPTAFPTSRGRSSRRRRARSRRRRCRRCRSCACCRRATPRSARRSARAARSTPGRSSSALSPAALRRRGARLEPGEQRVGELLLAVDLERHHVLRLGRPWPPARPRGARVRRRGSPARSRGISPRCPCPRAAASCSTTMDSLAWMAAATWRVSSTLAVMQPAASSVTARRGQAPAATARRPDRSIVAAWWVLMASHRSRCRPEYTPRVPRDRPRPDATSAEQVALPRRRRIAQELAAVEARPVRHR